MTKSLLLNELLYIDEHRSCRNYLKEVECGFKYIELEQDTHINEKCAKWNYLLLFVEGEFIISMNQFKKHKFSKGSMVLLPKHSKLKGWGSSGAKLISLSFDIPKGSCDLLILESLADICHTMNYDFTPTLIRYPIFPYLDTLSYCLKNKMNCGHFHELMEKELFFLIRGFYTKEEIARLFYPMIGQDLSFKKMVIENFQTVDNINDLITISNIGRSKFFTKFKNVFGMTAKQWMLKQKNIRIIGKSMQPGITVKELMQECMFDSQPYFTLYCKQHFGCTPVELIRKNQSENQ